MALSERKAGRIYWRHAVRAHGLAMEALATAWVAPEHRVGGAPLDGARYAKAMDALLRGVRGTRGTGRGRPR